MELELLIFVLICIYYPMAIVVFIPVYIIVVLVSFHQKNKAFWDGLKAESETLRPFYAELEILKARSEERKARYKQLEDRLYYSDRHPGIKPPPGNLDFTDEEFAFMDCMCACNSRKDGPADDEHFNMLDYYRWFERCMREETKQWERKTSILPIITEQRLLSVTHIIR